MAGPKKTGGLGKGLDALFGNMEVAIEKKPVEVAEVIIKNDDRGKENTDNTAIAGDIAYIDINV